MLQSLNRLKSTTLTALVERWRPESHIFHLLVGECIVTLEDVALHLSLCVDGKPINDLTYYDWEQMCAKYIRVVPPKNALVGSTLKLKWLKENMLTLPAKSTQQ